MAFSWSHSRLNAFETCPRRYYELNVSKSVKEAKGEAAVEGLEVHSALESALLRGNELPPHLHRLQPLVDQLHSDSDVVLAETKLCIDRNYKPVGWKDWNNAWCRGIVDVVRMRNTAAFVADYKTGKPKKDPDQLALCAALMFAHHEKLQVVTTAFIWTHHPEKPTTGRYTRDDVPGIWASFLPRVNRLEAAYKEQRWPERPSGLCKKHCPVTGCIHNGNHY